VLAYESARVSLERLDMSAALEALDNVLEAARTEELNPVETMDRLLRIEAEARHERRVKANTSFAGLPYRRSLDDFDFSAQPSIDREVVERLGTLRFIKEGTNVIFLGPPGVGKTHLAVALAVRALEAGHKAYFITMSRLVRKHAEYMRKDKADRLLTTLIRPAVLVLDEIGYTPLQRDSATLLFDVVAARYRRRKPIILTSNKSWGKWGEILPDRVMASAILDRLLHYSVTINISGDSYRLRQHREHGMLPSDRVGKEGSGGESVASKPANLLHS
jgi:DNA replication protein DnaC